MKPQNRFFHPVLWKSDIMAQINLLFQCKTNFMDNYTQESCNMIPR